MGYFSLFGAIAAFLIGIYIEKKVEPHAEEASEFASKREINYRRIFVMSMQQRQWVTFHDI